MTLLVAYLASIPPLSPLNRAQPGFYSCIHLAPSILYASGEASFTGISKNCVNKNSKSPSPSQSPRGKNGQFNQSELLGIVGLTQFTYLLKFLFEAPNCWRLLATQLDNETNTEVDRTKESLREMEPDQLQGTPKFNPPHQSAREDTEKRADVCRTF